MGPHPFLTLFGEWILPGPEVRVECQSYLTRIGRKPKPVTLTPKIDEPLLAVLVENANSRRKGLAILSRFSRLGLHILVYPMHVVMHRLCRKFRNKVVGELYPTPMADPNKRPVRSWDPGCILVNNFLQFFLDFDDGL